MGQIKHLVLLEGSVKVVVGAVAAAREHGRNCRARRLAIDGDAETVGSIATVGAVIVRMGGWEVCRGDGWQAAGDKSGLNGGVCRRILGRYSRDSHGGLGSRFCRRLCCRGNSRLPSRDFGWSVSDQAAGATAGVSGEAFQAAAFIRCDSSGNVAAAGVLVLDLSSTALE